jgi:Cell Wall Hydrolase
MAPAPTIPALPMTDLDRVFLAIVMWKENRGGGTPGMTSVANVIQNRAAKRGTTVYSECVRPLQFSSITAKGDPELTLWPAATDPAFVEALALAEGELTDITGSATLYYAPKAISTTKRITLLDGRSVPFPGTWNPAAVEFTVEIADQLFFREK